MFARFLLYDSRQQLQGPEYYKFLSTDGRLLQAGFGGGTCSKGLLERRNHAYADVIKTIHVNAERKHTLASRATKSSPPSSIVLSPPHSKHFGSLCTSPYAIKFVTPNTFWVLSSATCRIFFRRSEVGLTRDVSSECIGRIEIMWF